MLVDEYKPTTQKALFHRQIVTHLKGCIKIIEQKAREQGNCKHVLFLCGPIGCGKTATIDVMLKAFHIIAVDSTELRSTEKILEAVQNLVSITDVTLENIEMWNRTTKKNKLNIVVVDNVDLCEKNIFSFVDLAYRKYKHNIPIVIIGNNPKLKDSLQFPADVIVDCFQFESPSLLELTKLVTDINVEKKLALTKDNIRTLVEKSMYDARQTFHLLEQWKGNRQDFQSFIDCADSKHVDLDLNHKLCRLLDDSTYDFQDIFCMAYSEPLAISNGLFQNGLNALSDIQGNGPRVMTAASSILDSISLSNTVHQMIYDDQCWDLYENFTAQSCVHPAYVFKSLGKSLGQHPSQSLQNLAPFRDLSYNFLNSFEEVKRICSANMSCKKLNPLGTMCNYFLTIDFDTCFHMVKMLLHHVQTLNVYFDTNKRGKNTTKKEKMDLCMSIEGEPKRALDSLVEKVYTYKLFETNIDDIRLSLNDYDVDMLQSGLHKIDLKVLKRLLNIFTLDNANKMFKSNVETSLKYKVLEKLVGELQEHALSCKAQHVDNVDFLTEDLDNIWNL